MIQTVINTLFSIIYPLFGIIFVFVDLLQGLFFAFAGVSGDRYNAFTLHYGSQAVGTGNSGEVNDNGILFYLLNTDLVKNMLISIGLLALFLIIVFTIMAFMKNAYAPKQKSWKEIILSAIKGLANFVFLPVCCLLGIWLGNILLQAINGATSYGGATQMSRKLFICCAYNANWWRGETSIKLADAKKIEGIAQTAKDMKYAIEYTAYSEDTTLWDASGECHDQTIVTYYADLVDKVFVSGCEYAPGIADRSIDIYTQAAWSFYNLSGFNYVLLIVGGIFMGYVLGSITFGMVKRLFKLIILYIISPAVCAMYPLDDGKAVGGWKSDFFKNTISAYGAVAGMNLFFSILPLFDNLDFMGGWTTAHGSSLLDIGSFLQLLLMICGLYMVNDFISLISSTFGAGDAYGDGKSLGANVRKTMKTVNKNAHAFGKTVGGAFVRTHQERKKAKAEGKSRTEVNNIGAKTFFGDIGASIRDGLFGKRVEGGKWTDREGGLLHYVTTEMGGVDYQTLPKDAKGQAKSRGDSLKKAAKRKKQQEEYETAARLFDGSMVTPSSGRKLNATEADVLNALLTKEQKQSIWHKDDVTGGTDNIDSGIVASLKTLFPDISAKFVAYAEARGYGDVVYAEAAKSKTLQLKTKSGAKVEGSDVSGYLNSVGDAVMADPNTTYSRAASAALRYYAISEYAISEKDSNRYDATTKKFNADAIDEAKIIMELKGKGFTAEEAKVYAGIVKSERERYNDTTDEERNARMGRLRDAAKDTSEAQMSALVKALQNTNLDTKVEIDEESLRSAWATAMQTGDMKTVKNLLKGAAEEVEKIRDEVTKSAKDATKREEDRKKEEQKAAAKK